MPTSRRSSPQQRRIALVAAAIALAACSTDSFAPVPTAPESPARANQTVNAPSAEVVPGEVLVKFDAGASTVARGAALRAANAQVGERIVTAAMRRAGDNEGVTILRTPMGVPAAVAALRALPGVVYAEPNYIYQHSDVSNDPYYTNGSLWGMYGSSTSPANQFGSHAGVAWNAGRTSCGDVYVGIIDEGYMYTHEDLAANAATNPGEISGNGIDDDGNGLVDDVYGWDFANGDNTVFDGTGDDHGTHVAGTIGAVGGNGKGVAGMCWSVRLMNAKFLGRNGGTTANAIKAVDYFTDLKTRHGIKLVATSNSWGGGGFSQGLQDAITRAGNADILFIAAAGNSTYDCDVTDCYPAKYPNANLIAVASITNTGGISSFSNFGATTIDLGAPGSGIYSTVPASSKGKIISSYASYSGTSMATPHVSGAAARYKAANPTATAAGVKAAILGSVTATSSLSGKTVSGGRLNVSTY